MIQTGYWLLISYKKKCASEGSSLIFNIYIEDKSQWRDKNPEEEAALFSIALLPLCLDVNRLLVAALTHDFYM